MYRKFLFFTINDSTIIDLLSSYQNKFKNLCKWDKALIIVLFVMVGQDYR